MDIGQEILVRGKIKFIYADGVAQVLFERKDPLNNQIAFVELEECSPAFAPRADTEFDTEMDDAWN